jgi:hypothetical protein
MYGRTPKPATLAFPIRNMDENVTPIAVAATLGFDNFEKSWEKDMVRLREPFLRYP